MITLESMCQDYLIERRSRGAELTMTGCLIRQFIAFLAACGESFITTSLVLEWACQPQAVQPNWHARRLSEICQFAQHAHRCDPRHEAPSQRLLPYRHHRPQPYIYRPAEIQDLIGAAHDLSGQLRPWTYATMLGLMAVTGMRTGEVVRLDRGDVDLHEGIITIRESKSGRSRINLCHPATTQRLRDYIERRDQHCPGAHTPAFFLSERAARVPGFTFRKTFQALSHITGLRPPDASHGPRLHDLRHTFAVNTLTGWYQAGVDVNRQLPQLVTWLGHCSIQDTYWYLSAVPELMTIVAQRLDAQQGRSTS